MFDFQFSALPLAAALERYSVITGQSVMFIDALVTGRTASPIQGHYTSQKALQILLTGTNLEVVDVSRNHQNAFTLREVRSLKSGTMKATKIRRYDGMVQLRVRQALCTDKRTIPGNYRSVLRFSILPSGLINNVALLSSSGNRNRDAALLSVLSRVQFSQPPSELIQPLTLAILPQDILPGSPCPGDDQS